MNCTKIVWTGSMQVGLAQKEFDETKVGPHDVLIQTRYSMISAGTDVATLRTQGQEPTDAGGAAVGEVLATGADVTNIKVGDRIFHYGQHATCILRDDTTFMLQYPAELDE